MDQMKAAFGKWAAPPAPPPIPNSIPQVVEGLRMNAHYKVLIVGQRGDNFPQEYRRHAQIVLWDSDKQLVAENIPKAVRLVLMTRFNNHPAMAAIRQECRARDPEILCPVKLYGTGEIKAILAPLVPLNGAEVEPTKEPEPMKLPVVAKPEPKTEPKPAKFSGGELTEFIRQYGDPWKHPREKEASRLLELAHAAGFSTTKGSIVAAMYRMRESAQRELAPGQPEAKPPAPKPEPRVAPTPTSALSEDDQEIMKILEVAVKQLQEVSAALGLIQYEVQTRAEKRRRLKELLAAVDEVKKGL